MPQCGRRWFMVAALILSGCSSAEKLPEGAPTPLPTETNAGLQPYPYTTPAPPPTPTGVDGVYRRVVRENVAGPPGACRRCPPYRLDVAEATLSLRRGVFRLLNDAEDPRSIDWRSVGHYSVAGQLIVFFNDPNCPTARGTYTWRVVGSSLTFEVVGDDCAFGGLRQRYLTAIPWEKSR